MWVIAVLLLIFFVLLRFGQIAKTRRMRLVFLCAAMAMAIPTSIFAVDLPKNDYALNAISGSMVASMLISELISVHILRRRVIPPCVRVKRCLSGFYNFLMSLFVIPIVIFLITTQSFHSFPGMLAIGPWAFIIIMFVLTLFEKTEICRNGLWQRRNLQPWEAYESFSWGRSTYDSVELRLLSKSWTVGLTRLMVPTEDRETVHQLLDENLPHLSPVRMNSCGS